jgi:putative hemolysin
MEILILSILILLNGFFALSEIALISSRQGRLEQLHKQGSRGAGKALKLLARSENFLSAIQVGITLIGIVTGVYGGINLADDVAPLFEKIPSTRAFADEIALTLTVIIITYFSIVFGELVPKTVAMSNPEAIAVRVAPSIGLFSSLFYPFVILLSLSTTLVNKIIGIKPRMDHMTEAELRQMLRTASSDGIIEKQHTQLHEKVFYFSDKRARHIMTHRTELEWIDIKKPAGELHQALEKASHSRIICCEGQLDHFLGSLNLKDYYRAINSGVLPDIRSLITEPNIIPESADALTVLSHFRTGSRQLCFVVNEYGGFEGIITLHDIIESIVGQIPDEGSTEEPHVYVREDQSILLSGDAPVETLAELIEGISIDFDELDYSTVAGFIFNLMNKVPAIGDKFSYQGYLFEIVDIDGNRIDKVLITKE